MRPHTKKSIAPIVITVLLLLYYGGVLCGCVFLPFPWMVKAAGAVVLGCLGGVCVYVLAQRMREIRSGEEDDLGNY